MQNVGESGSGDDGSGKLRSVMAAACGVDDTIYSRDAMVMMLFDFRVNIMFV